MPIICYIEFGGTKIIKENIPNTGNYTFQLTTEERNKLYNACPNSNILPVVYGVETQINGEKKWSFLERTMTVVDSNPKFSNFTYQDIDEKTIKLTGNNQTVIKGNNEIKVIISNANKAIAKNGATMSKYMAVCGNKVAFKEYQATGEVSLSLNNVEDRTITVYAIDSRGNGTPFMKTFSGWKDYSDILIKTATAVRTNGIGKETKLTLEGELWKDNFGLIENQLISCTYKYKKAEESQYGSEITITTNLKLDEKGKFTANLLIKGDNGAEGFNVENSYNIEITVSDQLKTAQFYTLLGTGKPGIAIHKNGVSFGAPYDEEEGGELQLKGKNIANIIKIIEAIKQKNSEPIGEFILWEGNQLFTNDGTFQYLGNYYNFLTCLLSKYPLKTGFKRSYKLQLDYTDNKSSGSTYIRFTDYDGGNIQEKLFPFTWGAVDSGIRKMAIVDAPDLSVYTGHIRLSCTQDYATGGSSRLYKLSLLVYDELEVL